MDDEYFETVRKIETARDFLKAAIKDLVCASNELDEYLKKIKNPFELMTNNNLKEELETISNKMNIYILMANNKFSVLNKYMNDEKKGEEK